MSKPLRIHRERGAVQLELGRLWLVQCAPGHPNRWMIGRRRDAAPIVRMNCRRRRDAVASG
jgi:hypothetical protein